MSKQELKDFIYVMKHLSKASAKVGLWCPDKMCDECSGPVHKACQYNKGKSISSFPGYIKDNIQKLSVLLGLEDGNA